MKYSYQFCYFFQPFCGINCAVKSRQISGLLVSVQAHRYYSRCVLPSRSFKWKAVTFSANYSVFFVSISIWKQHTSPKFNIFCLCCIPLYKMFFFLIEQDFFLGPAIWFTYLNLGQRLKPLNISSEIRQNVRVRLIIMPTWFTHRHISAPPTRI